MSYVHAHVYAHVPMVMSKCTPASSFATADSTESSFFCSTRSYLRVDMCMGVRTDMCEDMCVGMHTHVQLGMCIDICIDVCVCTGAQTRVWPWASTCCMDM